MSEWPNAASNRQPRLPNQYDTPVRINMLARSRTSSFRARPLRRLINISQIKSIRWQFYQLQVGKITALNLLFFAFLFQDLFVLRNLQLSSVQNAGTLRSRPVSVVRVLLHVQLAQPRLFGVVALLIGVRHFLPFSTCRMNERSVSVLSLKTMGE